jgi:hypothetical protein
MHRFLTFPEPKDQINQPSNERNQGNDSPECFLSDGPEILAHNVNNRQNRQQVKHHTYFYPKQYSCCIQFDPSISFRPEIALFRNFFVNLRNYLCGVPFVRLRVIPRFP